MSLFVGKNILAPMMSVCTLPVRILALRYGADLVYTNEIIDHNLIKTRKIINENINTIDFLDVKGKEIFRTCDLERNKVILQLGTNCPDRALKAGKLVENYISGLDVNMGCPKDFSTNFGMGAALLSDPIRAYDILKNLVDNLSIPITCKVRILANKDETLRFVEKMVSSGIKAIAVHARTQYENPKELDHIDYIQHIVQHVQIPVIANGGSLYLKSIDDINEYKKRTKCSSVMIGRAARWNLSVFRKEGPLPIDDVMLEFIRLALHYDTHIHVKYMLSHMMRNNLESALGRALIASETLQEICELWGLHNEYIESRKRIKTDYASLIKDQIKNSEEEKQAIVFEMPTLFDLSEYKNKTLPKTKLLKWAVMNEQSPPNYIRSDDKVILHFNNTKYSSSIRQKNYLFAEQAAALVCLQSLGFL